MQATDNKPGVREELTERLYKCAPALIRELLCAVSGNLYRLEEIRLRADAPSSYRIFGRDYLLHERVDGIALVRILDVLTEGSEYAYSEKLAEGYLTVFGVRVGVIGNNPVRSLVFRIPVSVIGMGRELYTAWRAFGECGTLIVSPPGGGKTTALRALAMHIGSGKYMRRVTAVDTRGEFLASDYRDSAVDIITGRGRDAGIEAAVRYSSPEVIMCDEVYSTSDAEALLGAVGAGVTVIATAHGTGEKEVRQRPHIDKLFTLGVFSAVISICRRGSDFLYTAEGVGNAFGRCYTDTFCMSFD